MYTSMYRDLRTNLPREVMSFLDFPFLPDMMGGRSHDHRRFCSHSEARSASCWLHDGCSHLPWCTQIELHVICIQQNDS